MTIEASSQEIIANSPAMAKILAMVQRIAKSSASTVLLLGESGAGKGLIARALHLQGSCASKPFINITCTAIPDSLLESELFGHEKGAFTDARTEKMGLLEMAHGGTVFLDEIGDISPSLQAKFLRFLEDKTFRKVGGTRDIQVSVRVIAATNKDLGGEVEAGRFRSDLFFRLNVIAVEVPAFRNRKEDILPLTRTFIRHFNEEFRKKVIGLDEEAQRCILEHSWPGNVRELRNVIERAVLLSQNERISSDDLPEDIRGAWKMESLPREFVTDCFSLPEEGIVLEELEKNLVRQALRRMQGNHAKAGKLLGINRHQIRYRIEKYGLSETACKFGNSPGNQHAALAR